MATRISLGDIGTPITAPCVDEDGNIVDLSSATVMQFQVTKSDGSATTWTAVAQGSPTLGIIGYTTRIGDIDRAGYWSIRGYLEIGSQKLTSVVERWLHVVPGGRF